MSRSDSTPLKVGVVGAGEMGANHCRVLSTLKGAELVGVVDDDPGRAAVAAKASGCEVFESVLSMLPHIDAATVAVPSAAHSQIAAQLLEGGVHCLVEKPLALTPAECAFLIDASRDKGLILSVGHVERYNPAVRQLKEILAAGHRILAIEARRMSAVSARVRDIDVVLDLMVHDIDIVLDLVQSTVTGVTARAITSRGHRDYVTALVTFESGVLACFTASRVTQKQVRTLDVTTDQRFFSLDYTGQELLIYRQGRIGGIHGQPATATTYSLDVNTERVFVRRVEPLAEELANFVAAVEGREEPRVTGHDAVAALEIVWEIQRQVATGA